MRNKGYAALALLLIALLVSLVAGEFTPDQEPREDAAAWGAQSAAKSVDLDGRMDPATGGMRDGPLIAPGSPMHDAARSAPATEPRNDRGETDLGSILFVIRNPHEVPLSGVLIRLRSDFGEKTAYTGSSGEAVFDGLVAGRYSYRLEPNGRSELAAEAFVLADGEARLLELRLDDYDRSIAGRVLDQRGQPVEGITVTARPYQGHTGARLSPPTEQRTESGPDGWFEITGLGEGEQELNALATERYAAGGAIVRAGTDSAVIAVTELRVLQVVGHVTDPAGQPLAGVEVSRVRGQGRRTDTDTMGRYELSVEYPGTERRPLFRFESEGYRPEEKALQEHALRSDGPVHLDARLVPIEHPIAVSVFLIDEQGAPVEGGSLHLYSRRSNTSYRGTSDAQGVVNLSDVLPGFDYRLTVQPDSGYRTFTWPMVDLTRERAPLEIMLESLPTGRVWGRMVDVSGKPVPHFSLWLHSDEAQGSWINVTGDSIGYFEVSDVPEGRLTLQTRSRPLFRTSGVELAAGSDVYVEVVLDWGGQILEGKVLGEGGEPIAGARVQLDWRGDWWLVDDHRSVRQTVADSDGMFVFSGLGGGPYDLKASAPGHLTRRIESRYGGEWIEVRLPAVGN